MPYSYKENRIVGGAGADDTYWEGLEDGKFKLSRCAECRTWIWPASWRCGTCGSWELDWTDVEPVGTVYAYTRTWYPFDRVPERAAQVPYVVVLAELPDAGNTRVLGVLKGDETGLRVGAAVRGEIDSPTPEAKGHAAIRWVLTR
ncbi:MAG: hypothetical protein ABS81_00800 [Pseudonocardia sp. SCN 72-86]|nr:MAG: hypothetical protein ABS81_00800 [Pseudonocardia sp. SCN 72-86]